MMMMAGVRRAGSTFTELLALLHVLHALKRFDLQNFIDFGFYGVFFKVLFICLPVTTKLFSMFLWRLVLAPPRGSYRHMHQIQVTAERA